MEFEAALSIVKKYLQINLDSEYDGIIVKKMAKSNLLGQENSTGKQTHIAITGPQRDAFPYICAAQYLTCSHDDIDDTIKRFFMCQIKANIYRSNIEPLDKTNSISFGEGQQKKSVYTTVWRRRGRDDEEQVQLSNLTLDDENFVKFRRLMHADDYIIILKVKSCLEYDWFIIPKQKTNNANDLKELEGAFIHKNTTTVVTMDKNIHMDAEISNETVSRLPSTAKECAKHIIDYIYGLDLFKSLKPYFKVNSASIKIDLEKMQNINLPVKALRYLFVLPKSANYDTTVANGKIRVFDKVYSISTLDGLYNGKLTSEWKDSPLDDDFDGNNLTALIKLVNEYYSNYLEIVKNEDTYFINIKKGYGERISFPSNILLYGVPGCGKSHYVEQEYESQITNDQSKVRVVFHPDYTNSDFVGQIMPVLKTEYKDNGEKEEKLKYDFVPGPFTSILKTAENNPTEKCLLIIEELNRGNAPAIFGEVFQLLDRDDDGTSKYAIYNSDIANEVYDDEKHPIRIPSNLSIIATMNTSDQNVFTMDTAFQRRWQMKHIPNKFEGKDLNEETKKHVAKLVPGSSISWKIFAITVNSKMGKASLGFAGTEDKSLGVYFATDKDLDSKDVFAEKVLKYLWDDAFKMGRSELFKEPERSLSYILETFEETEGDALKAVLLDSVYKEMEEKMPTAEELEPVEEAESVDAEPEEEE